MQRSQHWQQSLGAVLCLLLAGLAAWGLWQVRPTGSGNGNSGRRMSF